MCPSISERHQYGSETERLAFYACHAHVPHQFRSIIRSPIHYVSAQGLRLHMVSFDPLIC